MTNAATVRQPRGAATREALLDAAEKLFAERGVASVSNRQIGEYAGQGNNTVVGYHFGTKEELLRQIVRRHQLSIEQIRQVAVAAVRGVGEARDWIDCFVRPAARHLGSLPQPSSYGRLTVQLLADPQLRRLLEEESSPAPALHRVLDEIDRTRPDMPRVVRAERHDMMRLIVLYCFAGRERALADGAAVSRSTWDDAATGIVDALVGVWQAPWTTNDGLP